MTRNLATYGDPFKDLVNFDTFASKGSSEPEDNDSPRKGAEEQSLLNHTSASTTGSTTKRKYESKVRLKRDPESLREDSKNRQKNLRKQMKDLFQQLALSIRPAVSPNESTKTILQKAVDYIQHLNFYLDCLQKENNGTLPCLPAPAKPPTKTSTKNPPSPPSNPAPFSFPETNFETEGDLENFIFQGSSTINESAQDPFQFFTGLGDPDDKSSNSSHFETCSTGSSENDDIFIFDSQNTHLNLLDFDSSIKKEDSATTADPLSPSIPTKVQKRHMSSSVSSLHSEASEENMLEYDDTPLLMASSTSANSQFDSFDSSFTPPAPLNLTPLPSLQFSSTNSSFSSYGAPQFQQSPSPAIHPFYMQQQQPFMPTQTPFSGGGGGGINPAQLKPQPMPIIKMETSMPPLSSSPASILGMPPLKQEIPPISPPPAHSKPHRVGSRSSVFNAFGKLELGKE